MNQPAPAAIVKMVRKVLQDEFSYRRPAGALKLKEEGSMWDSTNNGLEIIEVP